MGILTGMMVRMFGLAVAPWMAGTGAAPADPAPLPPILPQIRNNPIAQSVLDAVGNLLQTTNGNTVHAK